MSYSRRYIGGALAGVVVVMTVLGASPASAHDQLAASSPSDGERLAAPPTEVTLQFTAEVMDLGDIGTAGTVVRVVDATGRDWAIGTPSIDRELVTAQVDPAMPTDAGYEVRWQVVSEDGHPISGVIPFTVGDGDPLTRQPSSGSSPQTTDTTTATSVDGDTGAPAYLRYVLVGAGGAAAALAVLAVVTLIRRSRKTSEQ